MPWSAESPLALDPGLAVWRPVAERLAGGRRAVAMLRHIPERRCAILLEQGHRRTVLKVYAGPRARPGFARLTELAGSEVADLAPRPLAVDPDGHVLHIEYLEGRPLDTVPDEEFPALCYLVGASLRRLHTSSVRFDRTWNVFDEVAQLVRIAPGGLSLDDVLDHCPPPEEPLVPSHRDFHPKQVIIGEEGIRFVDFDDCAMAPAGLDIGNFLAHLEADEVLGIRPRADASRAFSAGYGDLPAGANLWKRLSLARLAGLAETRHQRPDWRDRLVAHTRAVPSSPGQAARLRVLNPTHLDRPVIMAISPGRTVVAKQAPAERLSAMEDLWRSSFGAGRLPPGLPRPFGVLGEWLLSEHLSGQPLGWRGEFDPRRLPEVAALAADFHECGLQVAERRDARSIRRSLERKVGSLDGEVAMVLRQALSALESPEDGELLASHGDFSPRNILVTEAGLRLIDFDRLRLADPARDVAYYGAWLWTSAALYAGGGTWGPADSLASAYEERRGVNLSRQTRFHRVAALVRIVHGWSVLQTDPGSALVVANEARRLAESPRDSRVRVA